MHCLKSISLGTIVLTFAGCCAPNDPNCHNSTIGPSSGEVVGAIVGVGAVIGVGTYFAVEHQHHYIKGCVLDGPDGLEIEQTGTHKRFILTGETSALKPGNWVRIHGSRAKRQKGSKVDPAFAVQHLEKTYGTCAVTPPASKTASTS